MGAEGIYPIDSQPAMPAMPAMGQNDDGILVFSPYFELNPWAGSWVSVHFSPQPYIRSSSHNRPRVFQGFLSSFSWEFQEITLAATYDLNFAVEFSELETLNIWFWPPVTDGKPPIHEAGCLHLWASAT